MPMDRREVAVLKKKGSIKNPCGNRNTQYLTCGGGYIKLQMLRKLYRILH